MNNKMKARFNTIHKDDNVLICYSSAVAGDIVYIDGHKIILKNDIELGHKIARYPLQVGDKVIKSGIPIGSMVARVKVGEHLHVHNMKSDYIHNYSPHETINSGI